ncbi:glycosyltransferase family 4 protein [Kaistia sp. MMO-174]|uniref:glycosyltransferase family 4 protein n=1 Tax=Kaistia sp. MMO-174 TaxID=3081256 RepID=UPI003016E4A3
MIRDPVPATVLFVFNFADSIFDFRGNLIETCVDRGYRVVVLAPDISGNVLVRLQALGIIVRDLPMQRTGLNPWRDARTFFAIRAMVRQTRADVVLLYTIKPIIWGSIASWTAGVRRILPVVTGLGYAFTGGQGRRRKLAGTVAAWLYRLALPCASTILFLNPDDRELFWRRGLLSGKARTVVLNGEGIDLAEFAVRFLPQRVSFLMIARLLGDKGIREFGAAARILKARHPDTPIRLVGYLDQSPDSITQAELDEIIASGVEFIGRLDDVRPAIAESSVYVLPSYREGTPRSTLEAMAMGRAVVTTDAPGCRETVVEGVNGYLVPPRDAVALAAAMEKFILDPGLAARMGAESRRIAEEKYDVNLVNAEIMRHAGL